MKIGENTAITHANRIDNPLGEGILTIKGIRIILKIETLVI